MRGVLLLAISLVALLAAPTSATTARLVIVGIADVDASTTRLQAIDLDGGEGVDIGVLHHGAGDTPNGLLVDEHRLVTVSPRDGELRLFDLITHEERSLATGLMKNQKPVLTSTKRGLSLVAVRPDGEAFDIVAIDLEGDDAGHADVLATTAAHRWVMGVPHAHKNGAPASAITVLAADIDADDTGVFDVDNGKLLRRTRLGAGVFRGGVVRADGRLLVEHEGIGAVRVGSLLQIAAKAHKRERAAELGVSGIVGLSPVVGGMRAAASTGNKDGSVVVDEGAGFVRWPGARVGVARPQAVTATGDVVVVTSVFRGQALPTELWALNKGGGHVLLKPPARTVVTVYGLLEASQ